MGFLGNFLYWGLMAILTSAGIAVIIAIVLIVTKDLLDLIEKLKMK